MKARRILGMAVAVGLLTVTQLQAADPVIYEGPIKIKLTILEQGDVTARGNTLTFKTDKIRVTNKDILDELDLHPSSQILVRITAEQGELVPQVIAKRGSDEEDITDALGDFAVIDNEALLGLLAGDDELELAGVVSGKFTETANSGKANIKLTAFIEGDQDLGDLGFAMAALVHANAKVSINSSGLVKLAISQKGQLMGGGDGFVVTGSYSASGKGSFDIDDVGDLLDDEDDD